MSAKGKWWLWEDIKIINPRLNNYSFIYEYFSVNIIEFPLCEDTKYDPKGKQKNVLDQISLRNG